ncbi:MAG: hypothetical protein N3E36_07205 [Sulfolobales archaeon]|nr:hypothetical protein [Ignisphaera sp.]MCX8199779.1 hypothetical protein [Sulfolobales archaeon]MDW8084982.1 hypothetical protein [Ignisphaera sp.]
MSLIDIELLELLYTLIPVRTMVLKPIGEMPLLTSSIYKGSEVMISRWLAEILEEENYVEILDNTLTSQDLAKLRFMHTQQRGRLLKLDEYFFTKARIAIEALESEAKKVSDIVLLKSVERMKEDFTEIANIRLSAILKAIQLKGVDTVEKELSIEERVLINRFRKILFCWLQKFVELR